MKFFLLAVLGVSSLVAVVQYYASTAGLGGVLFSGGSAAAIIGIGWLTYRKGGV